MDETISTFCRTLGTFCNQLQSTCHVLKEAVHRRPIPLDSAIVTFTQGLDRRILTASEDLNVLESMAFGTVSFEELLGHCNELYKKNHNDWVELECHLRNCGYEPEIETDNEEEVWSLATPLPAETKLSGTGAGSDQLPYTSALSSVKKRLNEELLFEGSMDLQNLGLSDVGLATLASEDKELSSPIMSFDEVKTFENGMISATVAATMEADEQLFMRSFDFSGSGGKTIVKISMSDYDKLPSHIRSLASWEDLSDAVEKINSALGKLNRPNDELLLSQDDLTSMGLGLKAKCYLLLLLRLNRLAMESVGGSIVYRVVEDQPS